MTVYIVKAEGLGLVKIGYAANLSARLSTLQSASPVPLSLVRSSDGTKGLEAWLHEHFSEYRKQGEWFSYHPDMLIIEFPKNLCVNDKERDFPLERIKPVDLRYAERIQKVLLDCYGREKGGAQRLAHAVGCTVKTARNWITGKSEPQSHHFIGIVSVCRDAAQLMDDMLDEAAAALGKPPHKKRFVDIHDQYPDAAA
ncbi:GIY-YIG nuclease family protein [Acetobacter oryzoeni]|uniref:GIY-YIG nuclease family protein n=1 Tax=Acetobacter oryzoeni TaxID=2500548 RepID=A0A5B9GL14_9PROT|nr:GIY-YIG nuclease family protein [Acetobacter oryzoeni]MCP1202279.1 GIY-YIG nuclease family protein [Acetobacter oryzoeni]QEE86004.1 GIY-YIG nuclease family protein [Acetobacter oryzoeni]